MLRLATAIFTLAAFAALLSACGDDDGGTGDAKLKVITTVSPITSIVENIGGTAIELEGVIPEDVNSHTFEPPQSTVSAIEAADLIILNGLQLEGATLELAESNKKDDADILLLGDETITPDLYRYDTSFPQDQGKPNPHLWPNPELATRYATLVHDKLVDMDEANKDYYDTNFEAFRKRLERLDQQIRVAAQTVPVANRKLVTYHASWAYWADRYGFTVIGPIQPAGFSEPSAGEVAGFVEQIKTEEVPAIFGSEVFPSDALEAMAEDAGAAYVDDLRDDDLPGQPGDKSHSYLGMMINNMRILIPALGGDASPMDIVDTSLVFEGESTARY
ncbi:MAG TPA: metal ABC transporter substrate-binding protein, partial [Dehalococcoidia bacterium]|nr:metal ABC transporter substrate-binding protein [Dehalococcoidia bacterium]